MSTSSVNATKGEKGKKFQSLKINLCTANKPTEPEQQQHKSSIQRKQHGMTSLGKVPTARRPTNLPSEKAEHGGNDPSVNLVPSGGPGWGNKQSETGSTTTPSLVQSSNSVTNVSVNNVATTGTSQQAPHAQLYPSLPPLLTMGGHVPVHHGHTDVKTWAMMTHGGESSAPNFLTPQSPLFQHEFPSLSSNSETSSAATPVTATATQKPMASTIVDTQYGPGPSLRPQTEGSWVQGGGRPQNSMGPTVGNQSMTAPAQGRPMGPFPPPAGPDGVRNNSGPSGVGVAPAGPYNSSVPQQHMITPQFAGMMPPFMLRNQYPGHFGSNFPGTLKAVGQGPPYGPYGPHHPNRFMQPGANAKRNYDDEDMKIRPIVKEEDLNHMASIGNDIGWAANEDIDYNQKLRFSDDEDDTGKDSGKNSNRLQSASKANEKQFDRKDSIDRENSKENLKDREKMYSHDQRNAEQKNAWQKRRTIMPAPVIPSARYQIPANGRFEEDDEDWLEKRRQKKEEMNIIIQRARERKEEEEKRFHEQQQAANLKLKKLEAAIEANQYGNKENKLPMGNEDMLPPWEKEKYQPPVMAAEEAKRSQTSAPVPVVKDASEFRELTQLVDRSNFVKKEVKERENVQQIGFSRTSGPVRFQNRQNSGSFPSNSSSSGPTRCIISQTTQFSSKTSNFNFITRAPCSESESHSEKDRDWKSSEDGRKDRDIERSSKESLHEREYNYNYSHGHDHDGDRKYDGKYNKEHESRGKFYSEKDDYSADSYNRDPYTGKTERKISENERDKSNKNYENRRYSESENQEKEDRRRSYDEMEKSRHYGSSNSRSPRTTFVENDTRERKRSREEAAYESSKLYNTDRDYYKKVDGPLREMNSEKDRIRDSIKVEHEVKKDSSKDECKSSLTYEDKRYRDSKECLPDDSYLMQDPRSYSWTDDGDIDDRKLRKDHYRDDRGDRYSQGQRHVPRPITRAKLEAKEMEFESKGNLTTLVRSDKKTELKKNESESTKEKEKSDKTVKSEAVTETSGHKSESHVEAPSAWNKKPKEESKTMAQSFAASDQNVEKSEEGKNKEEKKKTSKTGSKDDHVEKSGEDERANERRKMEHRGNKDPRNWSRNSMYQGANSYGGSSRSTNPKLRRSNKAPSTKGSSRRDSKYSESEYSDEISGSGREDRNSRSERDKNRAVKMKRYDRVEYRTDDRDYGNSRGRSNRDYYYKPPQRGRNSGFRAAGGVNKRVDGYGPPSTRSPFSGTGSEDKRPKSNKDAAGNNEQTATEKKSEGKSNRTVDRSWKKNIESQIENKSAVSSPTSVPTTEANDESFATASEGSDSEDGRQAVKGKSAYGTSKRSPAVVATKPPRKYRSTSRKRYENRKTTASLYSRKEANTYTTGRRMPSSGTGKSSSKKENEKYEDKGSISNKDEMKSSDKQSREYGDGANKKGVKVRNRSNTRKTANSSSAGGVANNRKNSDNSPRMQTKSKTDNKVGEYRESKNTDSSMMHFRAEVGSSVPAPPPTGNAWDKPLTGALRTGSPSTSKPSASFTGSNSNVTTSVIGQEKSLGQLGDHRADPAALTSDQSGSSISAEKVTPRVLENLDGSTPPVQTIIFENTNYKSAPTDISSKNKYGNQMKNHRFDKDSKFECLESSVSSFGNESSNPELPNNKHDPLQMALFNKNEDVTDMKLDFSFDSSDFSKLADDNSKSRKAIELSHAMHLVQSTDADLNFKIASVKKVWDGSLEHDDKYDGGMANTSTSFSPSFSNHSTDPSSGSCYSRVDSSGHVQVDDVSGLGQGEVVFSSQMQNVNAGYGSSSNCPTVVMKSDLSGSSSNVCKVKPQPQGCGTNIVNAAQSSVISTTLVSQPPPMSSPSYTFSCSTPQSNMSNSNVIANALPQLNFPTTFNVPSQVLFNSSQAAAAQTPPGVYQTYIDNAQVGTRSQFSHQFSTTFGLSNQAPLGQTSAFNQQSLYMPPPPPPSAPALMDMYSTQMPQFRIQPPAYGNTQQMTSPPNTVLISSTTNNTLMSSSIKPTNQQISAAGTKAGYQTGQTTPQVYMTFDAAAQLLNHQSFMSNPMVPRPTNNVVAAGTNSYYSTPPAAGQTGFYPGTNSTLQAQGGPTINLTTYAQSANQKLNPMANYNTQLYRSTQQTYMKSSGSASNLPTDFGSNKAFTIANQDVLNQGYAPAKQRLPPGSKNITVPQGLTQHSMSQNAYGYQTSNAMRNNGSASKGSQYPHPIQRPVSQGNNSSRANGGGGGGSNASNTSNAHRMPVRNNSHHLVNNIQQTPSSAYYSTSSGYSTSKLDASQIDSKSESSADVKLADGMKTMNAKSASTTNDKNVSSNE